MMLFSMCHLLGIKLDSNLILGCGHCSVENDIFQFYRDVFDFILETDKLNASGKIVSFAFSL